MLEVFSIDWIMSIETKSKNKITLNMSNFEVQINDLNVSYPWEYEKSWILLEVKEYSNILFYSFTIEWKHLFIIVDDKFDIKEEILSFFWDVDILIIIWSKESAKIFENIEARIVIPFWEGKTIFLNTLGQHIEEIDSYKLKWEFLLDSTEFVNLR